MAHHLRDGRRVQLELGFDVTWAVLAPRNLRPPHAGVRVRQVQRDRLRVGLSPAVPIRDDFEGPKGSPSESRPGCHYEDRDKQCDTGKRTTLGAIR
jgi:hypothetical protein